MARRGPRPAHERLKRLLVMLPWLMERGEVAIAEMAAHFSLTESELVADIELAAMCGLPPFVDELIDVFIDEGMVFTGIPRVFTRPLRLTAPEGFSLLASSRAAMALPGADADGPLGRALGKLAKTLGDDGVVVDLGRPATVDRVAAAAAGGVRLSITYWTPARDEATQRQVTPRMVFADGGHWYMVADDHRSVSERVFRLDRILDIDDTGIVDPMRAVATPDPQRWMNDDPDIERVTIRLPAELTWMVERYPIDSMAAEPASESGASCTVVMPVTSEEWLRRLLLRIGPRAVVVAPQRWATLAADTASKVLERYGMVSRAT